MTADLLSYWEFTGVAATFAARYKNNVTTCSDGGLYRVMGTKLLVLRPPRRWDFTEVIEAHPAVRMDRFRTVPLNSIPDFLPHRAAAPCYYADRTFRPTSKGRRATRKAKQNGVKRTRAEREELVALLETWAEWAKGRHEMVVTGHYRKMIDSRAFRFIGYRLDGRLMGAVGYTADGDQACIGYCKHLPAEWWLSTHMWTDAVQLLLGKYRAVNCGDTADGLKTQVGLKRIGQRVLAKEVAPKLLPASRAFRKQTRTLAQAAARRPRDDRRCHRACLKRAMLRLKGLFESRWIWWFYEERIMPRTPAESQRHEAEAPGRFHDAVLVLDYPNHRLTDLARDLGWFERQFLASGFPAAIVYSDAAVGRFRTQRGRYEDARRISLPTIEDYWREVAAMWRSIGDYRLAAVYWHARVAHLVLVKGAEAGRPEIRSADDD